MIDIGKFPDRIVEVKENLKVARTHRTFAIKSNLDRHEDRFYSDRLLMKASLNMHLTIVA